MIIKTLIYSPRMVWSGALPAELDSPNTLLLLFADSLLMVEDSRLLKELQATFPQSVLIGCSTLLPFANGGLVEGGAVLGVCRFEHTRLMTTIQCLQSPAESWTAGHAVGERLYAPDLRLVLLLGDDRALNANEFMKGLNSVSPEPLLISGGMASHPDFAEGNRVLLLQDRLWSRAAVAVGLYSDHLMAEQAEDVGLQLHSELYKVTGVRDRVVYEIDNRPALDVYFDFLGELAVRLDLIHMFPVGFYLDPDSPMNVIRSVLMLDEENRTLVFATDLPEDRYIRFMVGFQSQFIECAKKVAAKVSQAAVARGGYQSLLALVVSCASRKFGLGHLVGQEPAVAYSALPPGTPQIGFYAYGEVAWSGTGFCKLHNHTVNMTLLGE